MSSQRKPITNDEKLMIIKSYADGIPPRTVATVIGKSVASIKMLYSRWKLNSTLPPKLINNRSKIDGQMSLLIKKQALESPKLGLKKLTAKTKKMYQKMFSISIINFSVPSYKSVGRFLHRNGFVHKKCTLKHP
jgi:transposase